MRAIHGTGCQTAWTINRGDKGDVCVLSSDPDSPRLVKEPRESSFLCKVRGEEEEDVCIRVGDIEVGGSMSDIP
jgi:hypothetical protein